MGSVAGDTVCKPIDIGLLGFKIEQGRRHGGVLGGLEPPSRRVPPPVGEFRHFCRG